MKIAVETIYSVSGLKIIELPENKTIEDIKNIFVKWDTAYVQFKDICEEYILDIREEECDFKRPNEIKIYSVNEDDEIDFNTELLKE